MHQVASLLLLLLVATAHGLSAPRLPNSPYPASPLVPTTAYTISNSYLSLSQRVLVESLQGQLAKTSAPAVYRTFPNSTLSYDLWLSILTQPPYNVQVNTTFENDLQGLIFNFNSSFSSYVLFSQQSTTDESVNFAISLCAALPRVLAVAEADLPLVAHLPMLFDVRNKSDFGWVLQNFGSLLSSRTLSFQVPSSPDQLADWTVFASAISYFDYGDLSKSNVSKAVFERMEGPVAALFGWGTSENGLVGFASGYSTMVHAADYAINLSFLANVARASASFSQKTHQTDVPNPPENTHTVCFLMTDGDNIQWILNNFMDWYNTPAKGKTNLGWTVSPALAELAPSILEYLYDTAANATFKEYFVAAPSGLGYSYPNNFANMTGFAEMTAEYMRLADLNIVNAITTADAVDPLNHIAPLTAQSNIDAVFLYPYDNYAGLKGQVYWSNGKPVISGRYNLWGSQFETPQSLAAKLNGLTKSITSAEGYSLIPVHVWTMTAADVATSVQLLGPGIDVVTPDVFVQRIRAHVKH